MPLEQEVVFQEMNEGKDKQHLLDTIGALRNMNVEVDSSKIETELKRYESVQGYKGKDNTPVEIRERIKVKIERLTRLKAEEMRKKPNFLSANFKDRKIPRGYGDNGHCFNCKSGDNYSRLRYISAKIILMRQEKGFERILKDIKDEILFTYCPSCGVAYNANDTLHMGHWTSIEL